MPKKEPTIATMTPEVSEFLDAYDRLGATDPTAVAELFHPTFLVLDPATAAALKPTVLASVLPARKLILDEPVAAVRWRVAVRRGVPAGGRVGDRAVLLCVCGRRLAA